MPRRLGGLVETGDCSSAISLLCRYRTCNYCFLRRFPVGDTPRHCLPLIAVSTLQYYIQFIGVIDHYDDQFLFQRCESCYEGGRADSRALNTVEGSIIVGICILIGYSEVSRSFGLVDFKQIMSLHLKVETSYNRKLGSQNGSLQLLTHCGGYSGPARHLVRYIFGLKTQVI